MLTVGIDDAGVEARLVSARLACPGCGAPLAPWGRARARTVRGSGVIQWRLRPRRARCLGCGVTHVLLPVCCLARRADAVAVIGAALTRAAAGWGHRRISVWLGRSSSTVRGWLRRFGARAGPARSAFTSLACEFDSDPQLPEPAGSALADAVAAIAAAARAALVRWPRAVCTVSPWLLASAVTAGRLLSPGATVELINTTRLW